MALPLFWKSGGVGTPDIRISAVLLWLERMSRYGCHAEAKFSGNRENTNAGKNNQRLTIIPSNPKRHFKPSTQRKQAGIINSPLLRLKRRSNSKNLSPRRRPADSARSTNLRLPPFGTGYAGQS
jgi:hypothetical protein